VVLTDPYILLKGNLRVLKRTRLNFSMMCNIFVSQALEHQLLEMFHAEKSI
jgi:hypothetical protein